MARSEHCCSAGSIQELTPLDGGRQELSRGAQSTALEPDRPKRLLRPRRNYGFAFPLDQRNNSGSASPAGRRRRSPPPRTLSSRPPSHSFNARRCGAPASVGLRVGRPRRPSRSDVWRCRSLGGPRRWVPRAFDIGPERTLELSPLAWVPRHVPRQLCRVLREAFGDQRPCRQRGQGGEHRRDAGQCRQQRTALGGGPDPDKSGDKRNE